jgi:rare lipoprotein A
MTCAHKTLPLGTKLKVTNLSNNKSVILTVNDRGPFHDMRMLDVTRAAAKKLDFLDEGEIEVSIEILNNEVPSNNLIVTTDSLSPFYKMEVIEEGIKGYSVKVASYLSEEKTLETVKDLKQKTGLEIYVQAVWHKKHFMYRIFAGKFDSKEKAEALKDKLSELYPECYVIELKPTTAERNLTDIK